MSGIQLGGVVRRLQRLAGGPVHEVSDGQLLERFRAAGEASAFEALVRRHGPMVLGVCRRVLRDGHAAEDAFQATFLVLLRRADALDRRHPLAGWLYTVAYHVALRARAEAARRRRTEAAALPHPHAEPAGELLWRELRPVLDEELDRLPQHYRAPVVLCYLEGRTNEEAGRLLGWPVGTVKSRLARARGLLRTRLTRRGLTLSAGLLSAAVESASASAAKLQKPSAAAVALADRALRTTPLAKLKMVAASLLVAGLTALGVGAFAGPAEARRQPLPPFAADPPAAAPVGSKNAPPAKAAAPKEAVTLSGRVLGADGAPLAGARVAVVGTPSRPGALVPEVQAETRTDRAGKFRLRVGRAAADHPAVLAWAPGHGLTWQYPLPEQGTEIELKLPAEVVIRGRVIDLQGQPAAGLKLQVTRLGPRETRHGWILVRKPDPADPDDGGAGWVDFYGLDARMRQAMSGLDTRGAKSAKQPPPPVPSTLAVHEAASHLPGWPATVTTDAQGRFVLRGVGRGQGAGLLVRDDRYAVQVLDFPARERGEETTRVLAPVRVLEGTLSDADNGKPVAGARVRIAPSGRAAGSSFSESLDGTDAAGRRGMLGSGYLVSFVLYDGRHDPEYLPPLEARTDAHGRFRFNLFRAGSYHLRVRGPDGKQYMPRTADLSWPGEAVVRKRLDLTLQRGALVRGRVTEGSDGSPLAGARVDFWCKGRKLPDGTGHPREVTTGKDGSFEALLPPGAWHLLVNGPERRYRVRKIALDRLTTDTPPARFTPPGPDATPYFFPDAWTLLDLKPGAERQVTVGLRRAPVLRARVVGPDGKPVAGAYLVRRPVVPLEPGVDPAGTARRARYDLRWPGDGNDKLVFRAAVYLGRRAPREDIRPVELRDGTFAIPVLDPEATYRLHFVDPSGQLGAVAELSGKQAGGEPVTVRLRPCGRATARLVDAQGKPLARHRPLLWLLVPPGPHPAPADFKDLRDHNLRTRDAVWAAYLDPARHGDGPRTDGQGRVTFPSLIPGATYRILLGPGKVRDFTAEPGRTTALGDVTLEAPAWSAELPTVRPAK